MSLEAMVWAWKQDVTSTECLVLLALADHANGDGLCWPGQKGLGAKCKVARETINRTIKALEAKGKLLIIARSDEVGRPVANQYQLCMKQGGTVTDDDRGSDSGSQGGVTDDHTNLPSESSKESTSTEEELDPVDLQEAWNEQIAPLGLAKVEILSPTRKQKALHRLHEHPEPKFWTQVLSNIRKSPFLLGRQNGNGNGKHEHWKANFDWLIDNDTNCIKVYEGRYAKEN
jgi:hypothetical protein